MKSIDRSSNERGSAVSLPPEHYWWRSPW